MKFIHAFLAATEHPAANGLRGQPPRRSKRTRYFRRRCHVSLRRALWPGLLRARRAAVQAASQEGINVEVVNNAAAIRVGRAERAAAVGCLIRGALKQRQQERINVKEVADAIAVQVAADARAAHQETDAPVFETEERVGAIG